MAWRVVGDYREAMTHNAPTTDWQSPEGDVPRYSRGDVAEVEGRLAVYMTGRASKHGRWEWMDGTWTTIPLGTIRVLFNVYDHAHTGVTSPELH